MKEHHHFIGLGGIGMSALAKIMLQKGHSVSGSDIAQNERVKELSQLGAQVFLGHSRDNLPAKGRVVYSSGISSDNPEKDASHLPYLHRQDLLSELMAEKPLSLGVIGSHGKTTTSSLLASVFLEARQDPSFAIGGILASLNSNAQHGQGPAFISELDESDKSFLKAYPTAAILTNIDNDHLDCYGSLEQLKDAFLQFANQVQDKSRLFYCQDDPLLASLSLPGIGYGQNAPLQMERFEQTGWSIRFDITFEGKRYEEVRLPLIGLYNAYNALAVFGLALKCGIPSDAIYRAFASFQGACRRQQQKFKAPFLLIDDYAHHPSEIKATLQALRQAYPKRRLVALFQPHRYSRVKECLKGFAPALMDSDLIIATDIYSAGEKPSFDQRELWLELQGLPFLHIPRHDLAAKALEHLKEGDVAVGLGAGDITHLAAEMAPLLGERAL
ncbi:MAG: Bifunctional enzyme MurC/Ddl [Chlamydiales bacterium]|jgi:UDP-N-acetylmuramate--alanine ligase|nr:Bifunctional enzyme MurC/Ddl [Chlamydiales bacterium]